MPQHDYEKGESATSASHTRSSPISLSDADVPEKAFKALSPSELNTSAFAGRLGGGQRYTLTLQDATVGDESADVYRDESWSTVHSLRGFKNPTLWKMAIIEGVAACTQV